MDRAYAELRASHEPLLEATQIKGDGETHPQVAATYLKLGVEHILGGVDHLLFVLALLILVKGARRLIATVTAFTLAHSLTLAGATLGFVHVPGPPVEATIALSIMFVAAEIVHGRRGDAGLTCLGLGRSPVCDRQRRRVLGYPTRRVILWILSRRRSGVRAVQRAADRKADA